MKIKLIQFATVNPAISEARNMPISQMDSYFYNLNITLSSLIKISHCYTLAHTRCSPSFWHWTFSRHT